MRTIQKAIGFEHRDELTALGVVRMPFRPPKISTESLKRLLQPSADAGPTIYASF